MKITNYPLQISSKSKTWGLRKLSPTDLWDKSKTLGLGRITNYVMILFVLLFIVSLFSVTVSAEDKWGGVDESVVEKYAEEHGRAARGPYINTDQGDLLLFVFLLAGAVGGFIGGYYWKELMDKAPQGSGASGQRAKT